MRTVWVGQSSAWAKARGAKAGAARSAAPTDEAKLRLFIFPLDDGLWHRRANRGEWIARSKQSLAVRLSADLASRRMDSTARRIVLGFTALLATMAMSWQPAAAAPPPTDAAAVRAEVARVYDWAGYQHDLPQAASDETPPKLPPPDYLRLLFELGPLAKAILVGLIVVLVVMLAMALYSGDWRWLSAPAPARPDEKLPAASRREQLKTRLQDADRSAVAGDWASAIHILLLTSIDLLRRRVGQDVPEAMTARELVGHAQLADQARGDFAALVGAAELCHFGGRSADRSLYDRCRAHYERLWGMPPEEPA
jgi:Domain of unknown function (DUF4129)